MKKAFFQLMICLFALAPTSAWGATDTRFFGRYCGDATVRPCRRVCLPPFGYPCVTRCRTVEIKNINVAVEHQQRSSGIGVIVGSGRAKVDDDDLKLGVSAVVVTAGSARGIVASNRFDAAGGTAELAADGVSLTLSSVISGQAFSIHVGKDRCGNAPPTAKITRPSNGALLEFNAPNLFQGTASDAEDSAFPAERMRFVSDRDGPLTGTVLSQPTSLEVTTQTLSPGSHRISFSATDSGGLTSTDTITVTVANSLRYAAKFVCGKPEDGSGAPGTYFTAVDIHNPSSASVSFLKRFSVALAEQKEGKLTGFQRAALGPDRSFRVECPEIQRTTGSQTGFLEGFVVLKSPDPLNVVAVYSAAGQSGFVETLHVQAVPGIRVPLKLADLVPEGRCDLTVTVRNVGAADAAASITTLDLGSGRIFNLPTPAIPAGGSVSLPAPTSRPSSDFGFTVTADSGAAVPESNESNNKAVVNCIG